ncbi:MAG TPA: sugar phosphate nucleotidyltransferase [Armatimonadota bacterium]|jgi:mannose-1-phosphate guanylyltransferase
MHAVIMAGGSGTRLWPASRKHHPKQLHALVSDQTLIRETLERILLVVPPEHTWVFTNEGYVSKMRAEVPEVTPEHVVSEPFPLGTSLAIGLAALMVSLEDPTATLLVAWSDNTVTEAEAFREALTLADRAAQKADGVIVGVRPTYAATGYGYIKMGHPLHDGGLEGAYWIERFVEKPNAKTAQEYLEDGGYLWNPGIAVWRVDRLLELFARFCPEEHEALMRLRPALGTEGEAEAIHRELGPLKKEAIDYTIHERAEHLATIPADLGWSDIGTWAALKDVLPPNQGSNLVRGPWTGLHTEGCLIYAKDRLITTLGVTDLVIVDTGDCILVAHRDNSQQVKDLVDRLKEQGHTHYL